MNTILLSNNNTILNTQKLIVKQYPVTREGESRHRQSNDMTHKVCIAYSNTTLT